MANHTTLFVDMTLRAWNAELSNTDKLFSTLTDEQLMREVSPSRNRGIYLLGHLTAEHDMMLPLLRFQEPMHGELKPVFVDAPDKSIATMPSLDHLRAQWKEVNDALMDHIKRLPASEWFTRHANISEEDFPKEPHRTG